MQVRARVRLGCARVARRARDGFALTIVISISVQDGVVLASDSAVEHRGQVYYSAEKTLQLIKGLPIGVLIAGDAAINNKAFIDVLKDFGAQCAGRNGAGGFDRGERARGEEEKREGEGEEVARAHEKRDGGTED